MRLRTTITEKNKTDAISDDLWRQLSAGGDPKAQQCGWLKDRFGASWQIVQRIMGELIAASDTAQSNRVMASLLKMKKLDLAALHKAYAG